MLTDRELGDLLRSVAAEPAAPEAAFEARLLARLQEARSAGAATRTRRWLSAGPLLGDRRIVAWVFALLLLASAIAVALVGSAVRQPPPLQQTKANASPVPVAAAQLHVGFKEAVPAPPDDIAVDQSSGLWMTSGGQLSRIDTISHDAGPAVNLGAHPVSAIVFPGSSVIATNSLVAASRDGATVAVIDTLDQTVVTSVTIDNPVGLAVDTSVEQLGQQDKALGVSAPPERVPAILVISGDARRVTELDGGTLAERWHQTVPGTPLLVAEGGGRIWVAARPDDDANGLILAAYEAGTGHPIGTVRLHAGWQAPRSFAVAQSGAYVGSAWVPDPATGSVSVVDSTSLSVVRTVEIGPDVTAGAIRPGGALFFTYATGTGTAGLLNGIAVVDPATFVVRRYLVRSDSDGSGHGLTGLATDDFNDGSCCNGVTWHVWFGMDWTGDESVGRVNEVEMP